MRRSATAFGLLICLGVLAACGESATNANLNARSAAVTATGVADADAGEAATPRAAAGTLTLGSPAAMSGCWPGAAGQSIEVEGEDVARKQYSAAPAMAIDPAKRYTATMVTNKGSIEVEFFPTEAPQTVNSFVCLARDGYYDGTPFHRIVSGFVIQGGDPTGTGSGGPGYQFADEPIIKEYERGTLAMANAGPNTNGSQFFIVLGDLRASLPKNYTIFGRVTSGMETVDAIAATPTRVGPGGREKSTPTEPVTMESVTVTET